MEEEVNFKTVHKVITVTPDGYELFGKSYEYEVSFSLDFTIATNGPGDGDAGHGGRVAMILRNGGGFANSLTICAGDAKRKIEWDEIQFIICGADEHSVLIEMLTEALNMLTKINPSFSII